MAAGLLAGCAALVPEAQLAPSAAPSPPARPAVAAPDGSAERLAAFFSAREAEQVAAGLRRLDGSRAPLPDDLDDIVDIYVDVALRDEYSLAGGRLRPSGAPAPLRRWQGQVRYNLIFGDSVPAATQQRDRAEAGRLIARMAQATGHPLRLMPASAGTGGNFHVLVLDPAERRAAGPMLRALVPGVDDTTVGLITGLPISAYCLVAAFSQGRGDVYTGAIAIVRAELPERTRHACLHEEMAQGLGLPNDSDRAVPSIFNDNQEFARLTSLDLLLLRIHYDNRLRPGMRAAQARPIVRRIVAELTGASEAS